MYYRDLLLCLALLMTSAAAKERVHVAAASSLRAPIEAIVADFEKHHPEYQIYISYAASGKLVAQVQHGAPYALLLVAEPEYLVELQQRGLLLTAPQIFGFGQLVVWHPQQQGSVADLITTAERIAMAQPRHAPYGKASQSYLSEYFPDTDFSGRLVYGENVAQAAHRVYVGAVPVGFVALSQMLQLEVPATDYTVLSDAQQLPHGLALTRQAQTQQGASLLSSFLFEESAQTILRQYGYESHAATK